MDAIRIEGLTQRRGRREVLSGIDLAIPQGSLCALVGANGAGKSTLLALLSTLLLPSQGCVRVLGLDTRRHGERIRRDIGVVFQEAALEPRLSARDNLLLIAHCYGMSARAAAGRCDELLQEAGWRDLAGRAVETLSGGQKRRLELMRATIAAPRLLLLDEPTQGLDAPTRRACWQQLRSQQAQGCTVLFSTHDPAEAREADHLLALSCGRLLACGAASELGDLDALWETAC